MIRCVIKSRAMSEKSLLKWRETVLSLPPKFRNAASWSSAQDGNVSQILAMRSFQHGTFTFVVLFGKTSVAAGPVHRLSVLRFSNDSFSLPKMTHTVSVEAPEDVGEIAFDVAPIDGFGAWVMLQFSSTRTNFYKFRADAIWIEDPILLHGKTFIHSTSEKFEIAPMCPCGKSQELAFYGAGPNKRLYLVSQTANGFKTTDLRFEIHGRLQNAEGCLINIFAGVWNKLSITKKGASVAQTGKINGLILDIRLFKTAVGTDGAVVLNRKGEVSICLDNDIREVKLAKGSIQSIEVAPDKSILIGDNDGNVYREAIYALNSPVQTLRFPSYVSENVTAICASSNGRVFVAVDGVLWQTDSAIEAQDWKTMAKYIGNILVVCVLIYLTLFIGI